ncbi:MAG: GIY-YIG nuclease family protein [Simplicispira sp.]|nr:GIY-YIG nuclease family protein [Simplicispira sp.]
MTSSSLPATSAPARRALLRQYKAARPPAGIFTLTNQANGRVYVGGSLNLDGAMNRMRFELNQRAHRNKVLQQDWLAAGPAQFVFAVVDRLKQRDDPHFDYQAELDTLLVLWREEIPCHGERGYHGARP